MGDRASIIRHDVPAALTVALVAIPQCMGFAALAGLPPVAGLYAAVVMGLVNGLVTSSTKSIIGPAITTSSMVYGVLASVARDDSSRWTEIAALLAVLVGGMTLVLAALRAAELVRFVSRSVLVGLTVGVGVLIFGAQLAPFLGIPMEREPTLGVLLYRTLLRAGETSRPDVVMGLATIGMVLLGSRVGRRFPAAFCAIVAGGVATWLLSGTGAGAGLAIIDPVPRELTTLPWPRYDGPFVTDLVFGAAAITVVGIIQTLALSKAFAARSGVRVNARRELIALGTSNIAAGFCGGFPGAESISRSAINDMAGARSRWSGVISAVVMAVVVLAAAPLSQYITKSAIAGLMMATAWSVVDWREVRIILTSPGQDRLVLLTTIVCLLVLPIHWAVLIGLAASVALFLRRASRLHLVEMVAGERAAFYEQPIDERTGASAITMLQVEGPLFFAHADEVGETLAAVFSRRPTVTILRMRRTQQIDFSVVTEIDRAVRAYEAAGGRFIVCGLSPRMRLELLASPLGRTIGANYMLPTTRKVFGSAHAAIGLAKEIVARQGAAAAGERPLLRRAERARGDEASLEGAWAYEI